MTRHRSRVPRPVTGISPTAQTPLLEFRTFGESVPKWIVWLAYNPNRDAGTYLILNNDGSIIRETTYPDGSVEVAQIALPSLHGKRFGHTRKIDKNSS